MAQDNYLERLFSSSTPEGKRMRKAIVAELLGTLLFQFMVGFSKHDALAAGVSYAVLLYGTQQISGGHLNPALTLAMVAAGYFHWVTALIYIITQIVGAVLGALLQIGLVPGVHWGQQPHSPGCYDPANDLTGAQAFGWETVLTFTLVYILFATAVYRPGHGSLSPLALGLTVYVATVAGGPWTGASINPARIFAGLIVYGCNLHGVWWIYLLSQVVGAFLGAGVAGYVFGYGSYTGADGNLRGETHEPLIGRDTESA